MTVTGCVNCAEMREEVVTLRDELRDLEEAKNTEIDALEASLSEIKEAMHWIAGYIADIQSATPPPSATRWLPRWTSTRRSRRELL